MSPSADDGLLACETRHKIELAHPLRHQFLTSEGGGPAQHCWHQGLDRWVLWISKEGSTPHWYGHVSSAMHLNHGETLFRPTAFFPTWGLARHGQDPCQRVAAVTSQVMSHIAAVGEAVHEEPRRIDPRIHAGALEQIRENARVVESEVIKVTARRRIPIAPAAPILGTTRCCECESHFLSESIEFEGSARAWSRTAKAMEKQDEGNTLARCGLWEDVLYVFEWESINGTHLADK